MAIHKLKSRYGEGELEGELDIYPLTGRLARVNLDIQFAIEGERRIEFVQEVQNIIEKYECPY